MKMPELKQSVFLRILSCIAIAGLGIGILCSVPTRVAFAADASDGSEFVTPQLEIAIPGVNLSSKQISVQKGSVQIGFLGAYINGIYNFLLGIVVITAAVMVVYGGFKYIIAATGADIQDGKERIKDAVLGLILVFASTTLLKVMNPSLGTLQPLTVSTVDQEYYSAILTGDQPPTQYPRAAAEAVAEKNIEENGTGVEGGMGPGIGAGVGGSESVAGGGGIDQSMNKNQGCGPAPGVKPIEALCNTVESCYNTYCIPAPHFDPAPPGLLEIEKTLVSFKDVPEDKKQAIAQFGIKFMYKPKDTMVSREAHDALIKAGAIALQKGYFLYVQDVARPLNNQIINFCKRVKESLDAGKGYFSGGMALPGSSNHGLGIAADILLKKMVNGKEVSLTPGGPVCDKKSNSNQIDNAVALGVENVAILQDIMAQAGWKRLCSEVWHFDFGGVYESDCFKCAFPPTPPHGQMKGCQVKYVPPVN